MSDEDLDTFVDSQLSGKIAKDRKRAKSYDRSRKTTMEMFHTPGLPSREREGLVAIGMDSQQALLQMLASMMQMQLDADRRREEHEKRDREERRQIREEERQARKDKDAREATEKKAWEQCHAEMAAIQKLKQLRRGKLKLQRGWRQKRPAANEIGFSSHFTRWKQPKTWRCI